MARVVLAMSGGVDSSVAAWLLREQGHDVIGLFMRHGQAEDACTSGPAAKQGCCSAADAADARRVADILGIPFYAVNFQQEFARIIDYFIAEYTAGRTPNPCIVCNTWLKFGKLFDYADSVGADFVATGHYARLVTQPDGDIALCRGLDESKDQSYVLFGIERRLLPRLMFPIGDHHKEGIRAMAERLGLPVAAKRDSQEICFVPDQDHARFIRQRRGQLDTSGEIVTTDGEVVGRHAGFERFTIGQRQGLGVAFGSPRYVVRIEPQSRRVVIGGQGDLARSDLIAANANWLIGSAEVGAAGQRESGTLQSPDAKGTGPCFRSDRGKGDSPIFADTKIGTVPGKTSVRRKMDQSPDFAAPLQQESGAALPPLRAQVKIRYRSRPFDASVSVLAAKRFRVCFDSPCRGVAPGQAAVCYQDNRLLGGGWIE